MLKESVCNGKLILGSISKGSIDVELGVGQNEMTLHNMKCFKTTPGIIWCYGSSDNRGNPAIQAVSSGDPNKHIRRADGVR